MLSSICCIEKSNLTLELDLSTRNSSERLNMCNGQTLQLSPLLCLGFPSSFSSSGSKDLTVSVINPVLKGGVM